MTTHIEYSPWRLHLNLWRFSYFAWRLKHPYWRLTRLGRSLVKAEYEVLGRARTCENPQQRALLEKVAMFCKMIWEDLKDFVEFRGAYLDSLRRLRVTTGQENWDQAEHTFRDCQKQLDAILVRVAQIDALLAETAEVGVL